MYKFLTGGATGAFSGYRWPAPRAAQAGDWVSAEGPLDPCRSGLHLCRGKDLPYWFLDELYTAEAGGPAAEHDTFVLVRRARLVRREPGWNQAAAYRFACDCAWQVRDLAAHGLVRTGGVGDADRLSAATTMSDLLRAATAAGSSDEKDTRLAGYAADIASYAAATQAQTGWPAAAATCGLIAATAARTAAGVPDEAAADAADAERGRQADRLLELAGLDG